MQFIPVKTRVMQPPKDDLFAVLDESLPTLASGDVVVVSSKVVAIDEGACIPTSEVEKTELVAKEAELQIPRSYWGTPLTIKHSAFIGTAGIDESNANGHYILLPKAPFKSAESIYDYLKAKHQLATLGVIITDSHSTPLRRGATGIAIGWWGFEPTASYVGEEDLFGRELQIEVSNLADGLAAGATVVMGEGDGAKPVVIARDVPNLVYTTQNTKDKLMVPFKDDTFRVLYERFLP